MSTCRTMPPMSSSQRLGKYILCCLANFLIFTSLTSAQSLTTNVNTSTCGVTKACWMQPSSCTTGTCTFLLTWTNDGNGQSVSFEMEGAVSSQNSYVAFGLSIDQQMGDDSVVDCVYNSGTNSIDVQSSWNTGDYNQPLSPNSQLGLVNGSTSTGYVNGHIVCQFQRLIGNSGSSQIYPLDSSTYYILMAQGPASNGATTIHSNKVASSSKYNFTSFSTSSSSSSSNGYSLSMNLMKAHGILMVFAWMVFASFGILLPRYFKTAWSDKTCCGTKIWFQIHQPSMIIALMMTAAGFIIIFIEGNGYVSDLPSPCLAHPPLGIVVMILALSNPIMAIFRCKPDHSDRIVFNISHLIVGELAQLSAVVTIFLGLYMPQFSFPFWPKAVMIAFICFHALVELILLIHSRCSRLGRKHSVEFNGDLAMNTLGVESKETTIDSDSGNTFKTIILIIHLIGVLGCAIAISVAIGLTSSG